LKYHVQLNRQIFSHTFSKKDPAQEKEFVAHLKIKYLEIPQRGHLITDMIKLLYFLDYIIFYLIPLSKLLFR
jgi:hypothetical protein